MVPIPNLTATGGAAYGGKAANHSINLVDSTGNGTSTSLARLIALSSGSSEMGGFTDAWNSNGPQGLPDPLRRLSEVTIPWIPIILVGFLGFYMWKHRK